ncbi:LOW QUALITY PROTEIN: hypothetical protein Cgig2_000424 [Carnegiea gigantea]|uniref:chitinase n=1 Tax=Carnegiea gigantea TaxID=171969 RepID=A0A9Q1JPD2_9CARY|nr:LOW QUALITY PROTEIN: hypothetical protein Cgig2_000424 [Carnegiea gigantea]
MKFSLLFLLLLLLMRGQEGEPQHCGEQAEVYGDIVAPLMLSVALDNCRRQCPPPFPLPPPLSPTPPPPTPLPPSPGAIPSTYSPKNSLRNSFSTVTTWPTQLAGFYTSKAFIEAARVFPEFGHAGDNTTRKREIAAFFGQTFYETTSTYKIRYAWGSVIDYCVPDTRWPCVPGKKYYGRVLFNFPSMLKTTSIKQYDA